LHQFKKYGTSPVLKWPTNQGSNLNSQYVSENIKI